MFLKTSLFFNIKKITNYIAYFQTIIIFASELRGI